MVANICAFLSLFTLTFWIASVKIDLFCMQGGFSYSGQRCTAVKVVLVMEEVADELVKQVNKGVEELTVGMPEVMLFLSLLLLAFAWPLHQSCMSLLLCCVCPHQGYVESLTAMH